MRAGNDLGSGRIGVLVGRIALPSMLAQFISVLYSIVDRIFIGQIPGEGALALAGAGVCAVSYTHLPTCSIRILERMGVKICAVMDTV